MEPDHAATLSDCCCSATRRRAVDMQRQDKPTMIAQFFRGDDLQHADGSSSRRATYSPRPGAHELTFCHGPDDPLAGGHDDLRPDATRYSSPRTPSAPSARSTASSSRTRCDFMTATILTRRAATTPTSSASTACRCRRCCKKAAALEIADALPAARLRLA